MNMMKDVNGCWEELQSLREGVGKRTLLLVVRVCKRRHFRGRYFLVEHPAGSLARAFEGIMNRLMNSCDAHYIVSDQCAYGAVGFGQWQNDSQTHRLALKQSAASQCLRQEMSLEVGCTSAGPWQQL